MKRKTNNSSIPGNNKSTPNLLSKRTREYQRYVKEQAKQRGNNTFDLQIPGATISSRLKTKVNQNQESVNRISRTLAPLLNGDSPNLNRKLSRQEQRLGEISLFIPLQSIWKLIIFCLFYSSLLTKLS